MKQRFSHTPQPDLSEANKTSTAFLKPFQLVVAMILLGATLALTLGVEFREKIPISKALNQFPLEIDEWKGTRQTMEQKFINALHFSDYVIMDYKNNDGKQVNFYVAYYESQRKGESIHSPESCLPGAKPSSTGPRGRPIPYSSTCNGPVTYRIMT